MPKSGDSSLKEIVNYQGLVPFQPFDHEGLRMQPLKLKVNPLSTFHMQPCLFFRDGIMCQLKKMIDEFVSEGANLFGYHQLRSVEDII